MNEHTTDVGSSLSVSGGGTEYRLCLPHLLPVAIDTERMLASANDLLERHPWASQSRDDARARSRAAFMLLCADKPHDAETILREAIRAQVEAGDDAGQTASELRLVQVLQRLERVAEAIALAHKAVTRLTRQSSESLHYALHHLGKAQLQAKQFEDACTTLTAALAIRQSLADEELIDSTNAALALLPPMPGEARVDHET